MMARARVVSGRQHEDLRQREPYLVLEAVVLLKNLSRMESGGADLELLVPIVRSRLNTVFGKSVLHGAMGEL